MLPMTVVVTASSASVVSSFPAVMDVCWRRVFVLLGPFSETKRVRSLPCSGLLCSPDAFCKFIF